MPGAMIEAVVREPHLTRLMRLDLLHAAFTVLYGEIKGGKDRPTPSATQQLCRGANLCVVLYRALTPIDERLVLGRWVRISSSATSVPCGPSFVSQTRAITPENLHPIHRSYINVWLSPAFNIIAVHARRSLVVGMNSISSRPFLRDSATFKST
jgi:hypothetical protein